MNKKSENKRDLKKTKNQKVVKSSVKSPVKKTKKIETVSTKKKVTTNVNKFLSSTRDLLFQTKEQEVKNWLFSVMKRRFLSVPISVRFISLSLFLFVFGRWLWWDIFFSIYVERIVQSVMLVSLIWMLWPIIKLLLVLQVWSLNDNTNRKYVIFLGKFFYLFTSIFYFFAWIFRSPTLLIIAVLLNWIGSVLVYVTYEWYIRATTESDKSESSWWLYFSSWHIAWVIGAVIASFLVKFLPLPYLFLFIGIFSILSLITDQKIPLLDKEKVKELFSKQSFLVHTIKKVFSRKPVKKAITFIKESPRHFIYTLWYEWLYNILEYIWFLFIPLIAIRNSFSLSQIALIFALMKLPFVTNFFVVSFSEKFNKKLFIAIVLIFLSFLYWTLWFEMSFGSIMIITFGISIWLSLIRPLVSALTSEASVKENAWAITWIQQFVWQIWKIAGSLWFGILSALFGMYSAFFLVGLSLFILATWGLAKRFNRHQAVKKRLLAKQKMEK